MKGIEEMLDLLLGDVEIPLPILVLLTIVAVIPLFATVIFAIDAIRLVAASRIIIKGKIRRLPDYPYEIEGVTQCEHSGLIRSNIARTNTASAKYEPELFRNGSAPSSSQGTYNYDESDGIPAVDRPLFKPKE